MKSEIEVSKEESRGEAKVDWKMSLFEPLNMFCLKLAIPET